MLLPCCIHTDSIVIAIEADLWASPMLTNQASVHLCVSTATKAIAAPAVQERRVTWGLGCDVLNSNVSVNNVWSGATVNLLFSCFAMFLSA